MSGCLAAHRAVHPCCAAPCTTEGVLAMGSFMLLFAMVGLGWGAHGVAQCAPLAGVSLCQSQK